MFKKILLRSIGVLFVLIISIVLLFVVANWGDQTLRPEVQAELNWQAPKVIDDNSFLLLLGVNAKEGVDPLVLGKRKLAAELQRFEKNRGVTNYDSDQAPDPDELPFVRPLTETCNYAESRSCVAFYLSRSAEQEQTLFKSHERLLAIFDRIKRSSNYQEIIPPHITASIPSYSGIMHAAELERMRAIRMIANGQRSQGLDALLQVSAFSQLWLENGVTLISHMIALANVQRDLRVMDELLQRFPELLSEQTKITHWIGRFSKERVGIARAFKNERQVSLGLTQGELTVSGDAQRNWFQRQIMKPFNRPNAALNLTYDWQMLWTNLLQAPSQTYLKEKAGIEEKRKELLGFGVGELYLRDPIIKILLNIASPGFYSYIEKHEDVFMHINLLALKLDILKQNLTVAAIPQFVQDHAAQYPNPYDGKAMSWDAEKQQLFVAVQQASNQIYQKEKVIRLKVLPD